MSRKSIKPTEKELEILQIIWEKGPSSVKDVHDALGGEQANGYTTILKMMQIMHEKGILARQKKGKLHLYRAAHAPDNVRNQLVDQFIQNVFKGSAMKLVMSALGNSASSDDELREIRKYLDSLEKKDNGN